MQFAHCPVCGFQVFKTARHHCDWEFVVICPCCATHYALDDINIMMSWADLTALSSTDRRVLYCRAWAQLRVQWIVGGMVFWLRERRPPDWDAAAQLARVHPNDLSDAPGLLDG